jgi:5-carboxymethyl-2-hydroxymuconate isomerase
MPHLTLEYTGNLVQQVRAGELLPALHRLLAQVAGIEAGNCKSRLVRLDDYCVGGGETRHAFVHLEIRILAGRAPEVKREIGAQSLAVLEDYFAPSLSEFELQITVEVIDMRRASYFKAAAREGAR